MIESLTVTNFYCFKERTTILFTAKKAVSYTHLTLPTNSRV